MVTRCLSRSFVAVASSFLSFAVLASGALFADVVSAAAPSVSVQILGSGGPVPNNDRASAGYLVWVDGKARVLVDAGGGTFQRFGATGAHVDDIAHVALTHLHVDHVADLDALVFGTFFGANKGELSVSGPGAGAGKGKAFPSLTAFLERQFGKSAGAFAYVGGLQGAKAARPFLALDVDPGASAPTVVYNKDGLRVSAVGVPHGPVPALGYLVEVGGKRLVFGGDQRLTDPRFLKLAQHADLAVIHTAIDADAGAFAKGLHATPDAIERFATKANIQHLVLSHWMPRSEKHEDAIVSSIRRTFKRPVTVATDLMCLSPSKAPPKRSKKRKGKMNKGTPAPPFVATGWRPPSSGKTTHRCGR